MKPNMKPEPNLNLECESRSQSIEELRVSITRTQVNRIEFSPQLARNETTSIAD